MDKCVKSKSKKELLDWFHESYPKSISLQEQSKGKCKFRLKSIKQVNGNSKIKEWTENDETEIVDWLVGKRTSFKLINTWNGS